MQYAEGSRFPRHTHPGGEEILVVSGTFSEEGHDYPAGWYLRNPPGSSHHPSSRDGATLFVKLRQMPSSETQVVRVDTRDPSRWTKRDGREACLLFEDAVERVTLERLPAGERLFGHPAAGGAELLVLEGGLTEGGDAYARGSWIRLPAGVVFTPSLPEALARAWQDTATWMAQVEQDRTPDVLVHQHELEGTAARELRDNRQPDWQRA